MTKDIGNEELYRRFASLSSEQKEMVLKVMDADEASQKSNILVKKLHVAIESGESKTVEFKSTLSLDLKKNSKEKYIELAALKTICGFLNSDGGLLIIGLDDTGGILGLDQEIEKFYQSNDKFLLHFRGLLKTKLGEKFFESIDQHLIRIDNKSILLVDCKPSTVPAYIEGTDYYIRTNPSTEKLDGPQLVDYIRQREERFRHLMNDASDLIADQKAKIDLQTQRIFKLEEEEKRLLDEISKAKTSGSELRVETGNLLVRVDTDVMHRGSLNTILTFSDGTVKTMKTSTFDPDFTITQKAKSLIGKRVKTTCWDPLNQPGKWSNQGYFRNIYEVD